MPWLWYADNAQDVDVSYETICVLDWLPSNAVSLVFSKKLSMYAARGISQDLAGMFYAPTPSLT